MKVTEGKEQMESSCKYKFVWSIYIWKFFKKTGDFFKLIIIVLL